MLNTYFYQNLASQFLHFNKCAGRPGSLTDNSLVSRFQSTGSLVDPIAREHLPPAAFPGPTHQDEVAAAACLKSLSGRLARLPVSMREPLDSSTLEQCLVVTLCHLRDKSKLLTVAWSLL